MEETEAKARLADQFLRKSQEHFSEGRLNEHDQGDLAIAVGVDKENKAIVIHFGKPVAWIGLGAPQARTLVETILAKCKEIE